MPDYLGLLRAVRHPTRIRSSQLVTRIVDDFAPFASLDSALIAGTAKLDGRSVTVLAQQKPTDRTVTGASAVNYGMMRGAGYWFVVDQLEAAAARGDSVLTLIDTPGADPSGTDAEHRVAWAISAAISALVSCPAPIVSVVIGEGGSGGALALQVADRRLMVSDAMYSVISPESCSAILFRESTELERAMGVLRPSAEQALRVGLVDGIVDWAGDLALTEHDRAAGTLRVAIARAFHEAWEIPTSERKRRRARALFGCGRRKTDLERFGPEAPSRPISLPATVRVRLQEQQPASVPQAAPPEMHKLARIGAGNDTIALLQHAYFAAAGDQGKQGPRVLCPKGRGGCGAVSAEEAYVGSGWSCPSCGVGERLSAMQWANLVCDPGSFQELYPTLDLSELEDAGYDTDAYRAQRNSARQRTGAHESLRIGVARIEGHGCAVAFSEFGFLGGTLGAVAGEKIRLLSEIAVSEHLPLVTVTSSGGARMQEGLLALAQMAKANAAVMRLLDSGRPHISVLVDPCTGGALASYATFATVILGEPRALVAFAGPRVMKLAGIPVDERELNTEGALRHGGVDEVVARTRLRGRIARYIEVDKKFSHRPAAPRESSHQRAEIQQWLDAFLARVSGLLVDEQPAGAGPARDRMIADLVPRLAKLALSDIPLLIQQVAQESDARVRANAVEALALFPLTSAKLLHRALDDANHRVRANAAVALLERDPNDPVALQTILQLSRSDEAVHRRTALVSVMRASVPGLRKTAIDLISDPDAQVRLTAAVGLFAVGEDELAGTHMEALLNDLGGYAVTLLESLQRFLPHDAQERLRRTLRG